MSTRLLARPRHLGCDLCRGTGRLQQMPCPTPVRVGTARVLRKLGNAAGMALLVALSASAALLLLVGAWRCLHPLAHALVTAVAR